MRRDTESRKTPSSTRSPNTNESSGHASSRSRSATSHEGFEQNVIQHFARHPNAYPWGGREAAEHPHTTVPEPPSAPETNEQVVPRGTRAGDVYTSLAQSYGALGKPTSLVHYDYRPYEEKIDDLIRSKGYETYYAGGKYGRPDLANRNYSTGHLMVYDPTPGQGGDFDDEALTRSWRKLHELSHAETYATLNDKYGEGRRLGRLGYQRTLREAKRAVEWEALAVLKQRELSEAVGHPIDDETFAREWNTVLHDAVHRAITGKFTNPEEEGFEPASKPVPLEVAFRQLEEHAHGLGLKGEDDLLKRRRTAAPVVSAAEYAQALDAFAAAVEETKDAPASDMKAWSRRRMPAWDFFRVAPRWANQVLRTKAIPAGKHKAVEVAVRVLNRRDLPKDEANWFVQNQKRFELLREAASWPERALTSGTASESGAGGDDVFSLGGFTVHNTVGAKGAALEGAKAVIAAAASASAGPVPLTEMAYGNLYLVGRIKRPNWAAWYMPTEDEVYLRPQVKGLPVETSAQHLLHELAHRFWRKRLSADAKKRFVRHHSQLGVGAHASFPPTGTVIEGLKVNKKTPKVISYEGGHAVLVDAETEAPLGKVDLGKFLGWMGEVTKQNAYPTPYAATDAEEHFCEAAALAAQGRLAEPHLAALKAALDGGDASRTAGKKTLERLLQKAPEDEALLRQLAEGDPTPNHDWLDRMYAWAKAGASPTEVIEVAHDVDRFSQALKGASQPANPYGYPTLAEAKVAIQALRDAKVTPKLRKRDAKYTVVYAGDGMTLYKAENKEAACVLGSDSDWCSSKWSGDWYERRREMYGPLMYIARFDDGRAYMLRVQDGQVVTAFNKRDDDMLRSSDAGYKAVVKVLGDLGLAEPPESKDLLRAVIDVLRPHGEWAHGGEPTRVAQEWLDLGFSAGQVDSWLDAGIWDANKAAQLSHEEISPHEVNRLRRELRSGSEQIGDYDVSTIVDAIQGAPVYAAVDELGVIRAVSAHDGDMNKFIAAIKDDFDASAARWSIYSARRLIPLDEAYDFARRPPPISEFNPKRIRVGEELELVELRNPRVESWLDDGVDPDVVYAWDKAVREDEALLDVLDEFTPRTWELVGSDTRGVTSELLAAWQAAPDDSGTFGEWLRQQTPRKAEHVTRERVTREQYREVTHEAVSAKYLGVFEGVDVYKVDGTWVRDKLDVDFVSGGHSARYTYIPSGEVWVEDGADKDVAAAIVHELVECAAMCDGASYDEGHALAAEVESVFRLHYEDDGTPFAVATSFLETPTNLESMERVAAVDVTTFDRLKVGESFYLLDTPKKERLTKVDVRRYETPDGERFETVPKRLVMVHRDDRRVTAAPAIDVPEVRGSPEFIEYITPYLRVLPFRQVRTAADERDDLEEDAGVEEVPDEVQRDVRPSGVAWPPPEVPKPLTYPGKTFDPGAAWHLRELPTGEVYDAWRGQVVPPEKVDEARANPPSISTARPAERKRLQKKVPEVLDPEQQERLRALKRKRESARPRPPPLTSDDVTLNALGVRPDGGVDNILAVLRRATPSIVRQQKRWYNQANQDVRAVATKYDVPPSVISAVTAITSPNTQWVDNVHAAEQMVLGKGREVIEYRKYVDEAAVRNWMLRIYPDLFVEKKTLGVMVYLPNVIKAQRVLDAYGASGKKNWTVDIAEPIKLTWDPNDRRAVAEAKKTYDQKVARGWTARLTKPMLKEGVLKPSWRQADILPFLAPFPADVGRLVLNAPFKPPMTPKSGPSKGKTRNAPKITAFFQSILNPNAHKETVVLDGHAINMWRGNIESLAKLDAPTEGQKDKMIADYREAARRSKEVLESVGIKLPEALKPQELQAVTWVVWREAVRRKDVKADEVGEADVGTERDDEDEPEETETGAGAGTGTDEGADEDEGADVSRTAYRRGGLLEVVAADLYAPTEEQEKKVLKVLEGPSKSYERDVTWAPELARSMWDPAHEAEDWPVAESEFVPPDVYDRDPEVAHLFESEEPWPEREPYEEDFGLRRQSPNEVDLKGDKGAENIRRVLAEATEEERKVYGDWYLVAHNQAKMIYAEANEARLVEGKSPLSFDTVCAVIATLSPGSRWEGNLRAARRLLLGKSVSGTGGFYPVNVYKALRAIAADDPSQALTGDTRKVRPFYETLRSPKEAASKAVVDRHMFAIWYGDPAAAEWSPSDRIYQKVQADVARVAKEEGITTQAVQAITWYLWRNRISAPRPTPSEETKATERAQLGDVPERDFARWRPPSMRMEEFASKHGHGQLIEISAAIGVTAADIRAKKKKRTRDKSDRFMGETYWLPKDSKFGHTRSVDAGEDAVEIRLDPAARVLREGERDFIALGREPSIEDVMQAAFEKGYDAVRVKDRLAILNEGAVAERTTRGPRPGWQAR